MDKGFSDAVGLDLGAEWQVGLNGTENIPAEGCSFLHKTAIHLLRHIALFFGLQDSESAFF